MDINSYKPKYSGLSGRSVVNADDLSPEEIFEVLHTARLLKRKHAVEEKQTSLEGKEILVLAKPTLACMNVVGELAVKQLGGSVTSLPLGGGVIEAITADKDYLSSLASFGVNAVIVSTDDPADAIKLRPNAPLTVIDANGKKSPLLALAALLTCWESCGRLSGIKLSVIGRAETAVGLLKMSAKCGLKVTAIAPEEALPNDEFVDSCAIYGTIFRTDDLCEGISEADVIFRTSGEDFGAMYRLDEINHTHAKESYAFISAFPINREGDVDGEIADGPHSRVMDMSKNLLLVTQAILSLTTGRSINE